MTPLAFEIPLRTTTGLNAREHFRVRAKRVNAEHAATCAHFAAAGTWRQRADLRHAAQHAPGLLVTLTRVSPRLADDDNAIAGLKSVRDAVAEELGTDDGPESQLYWRYLQAKGPFAVKVSIERMEAT